MGCRTRRPIGNLVRVALGPSGSLGISRTAPGRGVWLCSKDSPTVPELDCLTLAARRAAFARALRTQVRPSEVALLVTMVTERARIVATGQNHQARADGPKNEAAKKD